VVFENIDHKKVVYENISHFLMVYEKFAVKLFLWRSEAEERSRVQEKHIHEDKSKYHFTAKQDVEELHFKFGTLCDRPKVHFFCIPFS
jgi:hypothetical protein